MKIGTYNILYARYDWKNRTQSLCNELRRVALDIVTLQEVHENYEHYSSGRMIEYVAKEAGYKYFIWDFPPDRDNTSGLGFLSNYPISKIKKTWIENSSDPIAGSIQITVDAARVVYCITNTHVSRNKGTFHAERQIVNLNDWINRNRSASEIHFLLGDFNFTAESNVHNFLCGKQSLFEKDADWIDIGEQYAKRIGKQPEDTVDPVNNPRWIDYERDYINGPMRFDWILVKENWKIRNTIKINDFQRFGDKILGENGVIPSDHYGVFVDFDRMNEVIEYEEMVKKWY